MLKNSVVAKPVIIETRNDIQFTPIPSSPAPPPPPPPPPPSGSKPTNKPTR